MNEVANMPLSTSLFGCFARYATQKHPKSPAQVAARYGL